MYQPIDRHGSNIVYRKIIQENIRLKKENAELKEKLDELSKTLKR